MRKHWRAMRAGLDRCDRLNFSEGTGSAATSQTEGTDAAASTVTTTSLGITNPSEGRSTKGTATPKIGSEST